GPPMSLTLQTEPTPTSPPAVVDLPDHTMRPRREADTVIFARAPMQIGRVLSVESTMPADPRQMRAPARLALASAAPAVGAIATAPLLFLCRHWSDRGVAPIFAAEVVLVACAIAFACRALRFRFR